MVKIVCAGLLAGSIPRSIGTLPPKGYHKLFVILQLCCCIISMCAVKRMELYYGQVFIFSLFSACQQYCMLMGQGN